MKRMSAAALLLAATQSGCIVAGYSSNSGWFIWPGGLGLLLIIFLVLLFSRR